MLQTIRDRLSGWIAALVIFIIAVALVISFGNMSTDVVSGNFAAKVNGEEIPMFEFRRVYQDQLLRQQQAAQGELSSEQQEQVKRNVLEGMVQERAVSQYVSKQGYRVSDKRVSDFIRAQPGFQVGGEFAQEAYIASLSNLGQTPDIFEERTRNRLEINQLQAGLIASSFYTPTEYRRFIELQQEQRKATLLRLSPVDFMPEVQIDAAAIEVYYQQNISRYQTEESVDLEYVELLLGDIAATVVVDDEALVEYYERNLDQYSTPEERRARHILIAIDEETDETEAEKTATRLAGRLSDGADFAELARENSADTGSAADGGELGWAAPGAYVEPFELALFDLKVGEISEPVRTQFGYHLIQLEEVRPGTQKSFTEVRDELLEQLQRQEAEDAFYEQAERLDDLALENPGSLALVAENTGLVLKQAAGFTRRGGEPFGFDADLIAAVFSPAVLEEGENSPLLEVGDDRAIVLRVLDHKLPEARPLEAVRAVIEGELRLQAASQMAVDRGAAAFARLESGEDFALIAKELDQPIETVGPLARNSDELPPDVLGAVFRAPAAVAGFRGLQTSDGGYAIYRLDEVISGKPASVPREQRDQVKMQLAQQAGNKDFGALLTDLRSSADLFVSPNTFAEDTDF